MDTSAALEPARSAELPTASVVAATDADAPAVADRHVYRVAERLTACQSAFQDILIARTLSYGRALFVDGAIQSAERDEHIYHETLVHPALLLHPAPRRVLILGGGEGAALREVLRHRSVRQATMVDIDGLLVSACRRHLPEWSAGAFEDHRARVIIADGKPWLEACRERFDVIIMDLTDQVELGPSFPLYTQAFYRTIEAHLTDAGILVVQAGELSAGEYFSHCSVRRTLATVFTHVVSGTQSIPSFFAQWSWVLASHAPIAHDLDARVVNARLAWRVASPLAFYNGAAHARLFTLTRDLESRLASRGTVVTDPESFRAAAADAGAASPGTDTACEWLVAK